MEKKKFDICDAFRALEDLDDSIVAPVLQEEKEIEFTCNELVEEFEADKPVDIYDDTDVDTIEAEDATKSTTDDTHEEKPEECVCICDKASISDIIADMTDIDFEGDLEIKPLLVDDEEIDVDCIKIEQDGEKVTVEINPECEECEDKEEALTESEDADKFRKAYEGSWYTIEGCGGSLEDWKKGYQDLLDKASIGKIKEWIEYTGKEMNEKYHLTGNNAYPDDLHCLAFSLDGLDIGKLSMFKIKMGDRWFDDIVNNNAAREESEEDEEDELDEALEDRPVDPALKSETYGNDVTDKVKKLLSSGFDVNTEVADKKTQYGWKSSIEVLNVYDKDNRIIGTIKPDAESYFADRYNEKLIDNALKSLVKNESLQEAIDVDLNDKDSIKAGKEELEKEVEEPVEEIVDVNANFESEVKKSHVGEFVLECTKCHGLKYIEKEALVKDEEQENIYNIEDECPHCHANDGWYLGGQVAEKKEYITDEEEENMFDENNFNDTVGPQFDEEEPAVEETSDESDLVFDEPVKEESLNEEAEETTAEVEIPDDVDETEEETASEEEPAEEEISIEEPVEETEKDSEDELHSFLDELHDKLNKEFETENDIKEFLTNLKDDIESILPEEESEDKESEDTSDIPEESDDDIDEVNSELEDKELEDFDEKDFEELTNKYIKEVYENVDNFKTTDVKLEEKKLVVEGIISFKSGKTLDSKFDFNCRKLKCGDYKLTGINESFTKDSKAFVVIAENNNNVLKAKSLKYNYLHEGLEISGTVVNYK